MELFPFVKGEIIPLSQVEDPLFANGILGEGVAILPADNYVYSPCDGVISVVYKTKHAICINSDEGMEILLHIGIDTVHLDGKYFENYVQENRRVRKGDKIVYFNREAIEKEGFDTSVLLIITNSDKLDKGVYLKKEKTKLKIK